MVATATLVRLHGGPASTPRASLAYAGLLTLQAAPFMLVLYLLFPRVAGPLWGLPQDASNARSGLPDPASACRTVPPTRPVAPITAIIVILLLCG